MWNKNPKLGKPQHTTQTLTPLLIISFENGNYVKKHLRGSTTQKVVIVKLSIKGCVCSRGCIRIIWSSASVDIFKGDGKWREIEVPFSNTGGKSQIKILKVDAFWSDASVLPGGLVVSSNSSDWLTAAVSHLTQISCCDITNCCEATGKDLNVWKHMAIPSAIIQYGRLSLWPFQFDCHATLRTLLPETKALCSVDDVMALLTMVNHLKWLIWDKPL